MSESKVNTENHFILIITASVRPASCIISVYSDQRVWITQSQHLPLLANT